MSESPPAVTPAETVIPDMMCRAVEKVFRTLVHRSVRLLRHYLPSRSSSLAADLESGHDDVVVGTVGFVGKANGVVYLYLTESLAIQLTSDILGLAPTDLHAGEFETVKDAIGELTNVIAGTFKNQLCDRGLECELTIPSILHGPRFRVENVANVARWAFEFETGNKRFFADVLCDQAP